MSDKQNCVPKTTYDIHRELCAKHVIPRSEFELIGPLDKYRDENYEIYLSKCKEFKARAELCKNENIRVLSNQKEKVGEFLIKPPEKTRKKYKRRKKKFILPPEVPTFELQMGKCLRKRHERPYNESWDPEDKLCCFEPWFRRYLVLCRFIQVGRTIILRNRLLKNLEILKTLTKENVEIFEIPVYRDDRAFYPDIFKQFTEPISNPTI